MPGIGERLQRERETRDMTVEDMAAATGIGQSYLEALESDQIEVLPGPAFGKLYIRAYAEVLGFDAQSWVEDYDRAQRGALGSEPAPPEPSRPRPVAEAIARWKAERAVPDEVAEPAPAEEPVQAEPEAPAEGPVKANHEAAIRPTLERIEALRPHAAFVPLLVGAVAIAIIATVYLGTRGTGDQPAPLPQPQPPPVVETPPTPPPQAPPAIETPPASQAPVVRPSREPGSLTVSEFGLGRRLVNHRLEGEGDRFDQGSRVCFTTRVLGGRRGEVVRHVWLYEGRVEQSISLTLGGADWRTYSNKTLGRAGSWVVEARDGKGGVLASVAFDCAAR